MVPIPEPSGFGSWVLRGYPQVVEYSRAVLRTISTHVKALATDPSRTASAGLLLGQGDRHLVRILACRPFRWETDPQETASTLSKTLRAARQEPELAPFVPVGWYRISREGIFQLSEADRLLGERFLTQSWQFILLVEPLEGGLARGALFVRGTGSEWPSSPTYVVDPLPGSLPTIESTSVRPPAHFDAPTAIPTGQPFPSRALLPAEPVEPGLGVLPKAAMTRPATTRARRNVYGRYLIPVTVLAVLVMVVLLTPSQTRASLVDTFHAKLTSLTRLVLKPSRGAAQVPLLKLTAQQTAQGLLIQWNAVPGATKGLLEIWDGELHRREALSQNELQKATYVFQPRSNEVRVRLRLESQQAEPLVEATRWVSSVKLPDSPPPVHVAPRSADELKREIEDLQIALRVQNQELTQLEQLVRTLRSRPASSRTELTPSGPATTPVTLRPPEPTARTEPLRQHEPAAPAPLSRSAPSGKMLWTGMLAPGSELLIEANKASSGTIVGALPGVPVRVVAYPAALTEEGLVAYSGQPEHAQRSLVEPPSAENAWNRTVYRWDPAQAARIEVIEAPSPANNWRRLRVRARTGAVTLLLIHWQRVE